MSSVDDVIAALPRKRQDTIRARGSELLARITRRMKLAEMRKGRKISQAKMAGGELTSLGVKPGNR